MKQPCCVAQWECWHFFFPFLWISGVHCLRSNPPPRQVPPNNKLSQRRHSLHKDNLDKPADCSIQGINGSEGWGGGDCSPISAFTCDLWVGAADCSSADISWPPISHSLSLLSSRRSSLQPSPKVWRPAKQHGTTAPVFPNTATNLVDAVLLKCILSFSRVIIVVHNMLVCSMWNTGCSKFPKYFLTIFQKCNFV